MTPVSQIALILAMVISPGWLVGEILQADAKGTARVESFASLTPNLPELLVRQYEVFGSDAAAIASEFRAKGHEGYAGYTWWNLNWEFDYQSTGQGCEIVKVQVTLAGRTQVPLWNPPSDASAQLVLNWNRYIRALTRHELGHWNFAKRAKTQLLRSLNSLSIDDDCQTLDTRANALGRQMVSIVTLLQSVYDLVSSHGATQGADVRTLSLD